MLMALNDYKIKKLVIDESAWDNRLSPSKINVEVSESEVTLNGEVPTYYAQQSAEADVLNVSGVTKIYDNLRIVHQNEKKLPPDSDLKKNIHNRLLWNPCIDETRIDVVVKKGTAILRGTVDSVWKKDLCRETISDTKGVKSVIDELSVVTTQRFEDRIIAETIMDALRRNLFVDQDRITVEIHNGYVCLTGSVRDMRELKMAHKVALYTRGVKDIANFLVIDRNHETF